ncbi:MAG TPA: RNA-binding transcriptional accessory protein, partial [Bacteroidetes bacterium]|nr:RNA-binding transcriptional accessory protein [Bacteroidota bacterium]
MTHFRHIADMLNISPGKVENTVRLLEEGATIPFISRYRKEVTGSLDEVQIAGIAAALKKLRELDKRKETVLHTIEEQGKLTDELRRRIENCWDAVELEDIYLPYKPKRATRASKARAKGLEPLALYLMEQHHQEVEEKAAGFVRGEVASVEDALKGARDIIAEMIHENEEARNKVRFAFKKGAFILSKVARGKEEEGVRYKDYFQYSELLKRCPSHRLLAIWRGEGEGFLRVSIEPDAEEVLYRLERIFLTGRGAATDQVKQALHDAYHRLLRPGIETEFRRAAKERADKEAIVVFVDNLRQLLLAPPLGQKRILAIDPGFRTGCKVV